MLLDDGTILRSQQLDQRFTARCNRIKWSRSFHDNDCGGPPASRLLLADEDTIHIYDLSDLEWHAVINGASSNSGKFIDVDFGYTADEVVVSSDFGLRTTIWSLLTSRGTEIKDPKFPTGGLCFRPRSGHLAVLTRETIKDVVMVLSPGTRGAESSFAPATIDAQGLKWSTDGKWLATWENASMGFAVLIYTATGNLFATYHGDHDVNTPGLGVRTVEWDPSGKYLLVEDHNNQIHLLSAQTFNNVAILKHSTVIDSTKATIWQEQIDTARTRSYLATVPPACPPSQTSLSNEATISPGINHISFNSNGTLLASRSDNTPTTVWIWDLVSLTLYAVLIHHSHVKSLQWNPQDVECLLIHCAMKSPIVHLWNMSWGAPRILPVSLTRPGGRIETSWLHTARSELATSIIMFGNAHNYALRNILDADDEDEPVDEVTNLSLSNLGPEDMFDEGHSMDLSPIKLSHDHFGMVTEEAEELEDTFDYRRHLAAVG
ncbi:hypothetical protein MMC13_004209 [Lambiella insularis]|nr:hypothetical protein [Lambiella insularis]